MATIKVTVHKVRPDRFEQLRATIAQIPDLFPGEDVKVQVTHHCGGNRECDPRKKASKPHIDVQLIARDGEDTDSAADRLPVIVKHLGIGKKVGAIRLVCLIDEAVCPESGAGLVPDPNGGAELVCTTCGYNWYSLVTTC